MTTWQVPGIQTSFLLRCGLSSSGFKHLDAFFALFVHDYLQTSRIQDPIPLFQRLHQPGGLFRGRQLVKSPPKHFAPCGPARTCPSIRSGHGAKAMPAAR